MQLLENEVVGRWLWNERRRRMNAGRNGKLLLWETAQSLKSDYSDSSAFLVAVKQCFDEGNAQEVLDFLLNEKFKDILELNGWEVIGLTLPFLNQLQSNTIYEEILQVVAEKCNAKEVYLALAEHLHTITSVKSLQTCIMFLQKAIMKIERKRTIFIQMICAELATLFSRLTRGIFAECSIPNSEKTYMILRNDNSPDLRKEDRFDDNEEEDLQTDAGVDELVEKRCCCLVDAGLTFIEPFLDLLRIHINTPFYSNSHSYCIPDADWTISSTCVSFFYGVLNYPLGSFPISSLRRFRRRLCPHCFQDSALAASFVIEALFSLRIPLITLLEQHFQDESDMEEDREYLEPVGKAMLVYLILVKNIGIRFFPFVISPYMLLQLTYHPAINLLKSHIKFPEARQNALKLLENIMSRLQENSLTPDIITSTQAFTLFETFIEILIFESSKVVRSDCIHLFTFSLKRFQISARLRILRHLSSRIVHSGAISFIILCAKNEAVEFEKENFCKIKDKLEDYFLQIFCFSMDFLREEDCDILLNSDRVIAALNFLRFLLLRCMANNDKFGVLSRFSYIENSYMSPLQQLADATYSYHLNVMKETVERKLEPDRRPNEDGEETVRKTESYNSFEEINVQGNQLALNVLDIIRSISARISELYNSANTER